jgi:hypothetical protein
MAPMNGNGNGHNDLPLFKDMIVLPGNYPPQPYTKEKIPEVVARWVFARDGNTCLECGATDDLTVDHIVPESRGGQLVPENLRTLCRSCNSKKGAKVVRNIFQMPGLPSPRRREPPYGPFPLRAWHTIFAMNNGLSLAEVGELMALRARAECLDEIAQLKARLCDAST